MALRDGLLNELTHEAKTTRRLLERVPEAKQDWTPHVKSTPLGRLAMHVASISTFVVRALTLDEFDIHPVGGERVKARPFESLEDLLKTHDDTTAAAQAALSGPASADDARMFETWSLKNQGQVVFAIPRIAIIRNLAMNHLVHHRGQLSVYLRLLDVPVPSIYGPSADEAI